jgi:general secretion pathway protein A
MPIHRMCPLPIPNFPKNENEEENENFFELQLISNFNFDSLSPALFILIAQPHLVERLKRPAFDAFYQRITLKISLQPFTLNETQLFISQVITNASASRPRPGPVSPNTQTQPQKLFNPQAVELIFKRSKGIPRLITTIMHQALIYGAAHNIPTIDENVICDIEDEL